MMAKCEGPPACIVISHDCSRKVDLGSPWRKWWRYEFGMNENHESAAHILNVIDHPATRASLTCFLQQYDMYVSSASDRQELVRHLRQDALDLIILDLRSRRGEGLELLRQMLSASVPVIITDDDRCTATDRIAALELGADDYIVEPIFPREILARVRAVLRRRPRKPAAVPRGSDGGGYRFAGFSLDLRARCLTTADGSQVLLTSREYALLVAFLRAPGRPLARAHLQSAVRVHDDILDRSIDVLVLRLRRKLEGHTRAGGVIQTKRGIGYALEIAVEKFG
jgi:two-component system OmpR family response regulator